MIADMFRSEDYSTGDDAEDRAHAALFAHFGVTNPNDWKSVAVALACTYSPGLLMDPKPCSSAVRKKYVGRPLEWDELAYSGLLFIIEEIQEHAKVNTITRNLPTLSSACDFFANDKGGESYRDRAWMVPKGLRTETYQNKLSIARKMRANMMNRVTETAAG